VKNSTDLLLASLDLLCCSDFQSIYLAFSFLLKSGLELLVQVIMGLPQARVEAVPQVLKDIIMQELG
jgi:hypothetical protein